MGEWIEHNGPCPVSGDTRVDVRLEDDSIFRNDLAGWWDDDDASQSSWGFRNGEDGIVAYRVVA